MMRNTNLILLCAVLLSVCANYGFGRTLLNERIVGGQVARPGQFPYQVGLLRARANDSTPLVFCSGAIVGNRWVLTSARCASERNVSDISVLVNSVNIIVDFEEVYNVERIELHPEYVLSTFENDIALLQLNTTLEYGDGIQSIALETRRADGGWRSVVSGYGHFSNGTESVDLRYLTTYTLENDECREQLGNRTRFLHESVVCTGQSPNTGLCVGDAGSPLVAHGQLIGLASWAFSCDEAGPNGYTRVSPYLNWVAETIRETESDA